MIEASETPESGHSGTFSIRSWLGQSGWVESRREHVRYLQSVHMTKASLIDHIAEEMKGTKKETEQIIDAVLASITEALVKGEKVDLRGFGSFQVSGKKERQGRNPRTGEAITIAARNVAVFKPSKELSGRLNGGSEDEPGNDITTDTVDQPQQGSEKVHGDKIDA
jgi:nucleoid DNA-binding protein